MDETERSVAELSAAYAAADAALKAVEEELENIKQRVDGSLAKQVPECDGPCTGRVTLAQIGPKK